METTFKCNGDTISLAMGNIDGVSGRESAAIEKLHSMIYRPIGLLPPVVRWISPLRRWAILERPPQIHTLSYTHAKQNEIGVDSKQYIFSLPLPWTIHLICLDADFYPSSVAVYAASGPIRDETDSIGLLPLPNHYVSGFVCLPNRDYNREMHTLSEGIGHGYELAWQGGFNIDMVQALQYSGRIKKPTFMFEDVEKKITPVKFYTRWEEASITDVLGWDWPDVRGWGTLAKPEEAALNNIGSLIAQALDEERQMHDINPVNFYLNTALTSSYA